MKRCLSYQPLIDTLGLSATNTSCCNSKYTNIKNKNRVNIGMSIIQYVDPNRNYTYKSK